ncbi:CYTH domain-containing protein [Candidatus Kaiserbacteria bacterium]|nr:CYTH domain-containing protein [Candidatus Kaiserbacteria bacterium]
MQSYEVEVKALLGGPERADEIRRALRDTDPTCDLRTKGKQLNHYFMGGTLQALAQAIAPHLSLGARVKLADFALHAKDFSVRTRQKDDQVLFVIKASVDDTTSANGIARMEIEEPVSLSLNDLDEIILGAEFNYQAKWSREREEYLCSGVNVTLDKNAGYGWLAEFERVVDDPTKLTEAEAHVRALMDTLKVEELPQDRLARMFAFYNEHWPEYYGTENIFEIQ